MVSQNSLRMLAPNVLLIPWDHRPGWTFEFERCNSIQKSPWFIKIFVITCIYRDYTCLSTMKTHWDICDQETFFAGSINKHVARKTIYSNHQEYWENDIGEGMQNVLHFCIFLNGIVFCVLQMQGSMCVECPTQIVRRYTLMPAESPCRNLWNINHWSPRCTHRLVVRDMCTSYPS